MSLMASLVTTSRMQWNVSCLVVHRQGTKIQRSTHNMAAWLPRRLSNSLQWRHNGHNSVSNHQPHDCLLSRLFRCRSKKTSKLRVIGPCAGNLPGPVNSPHKWPVTRKMFPFDDVIMFKAWQSYTHTLSRSLRDVTHRRPRGRIRCARSGWCWCRDPSTRAGWPPLLQAWHATCRPWHPRLCCSPPHQHRGHSGRTWCKMSGPWAAWWWARWSVMNTSNDSDIFYYIADQPLESELRASGWYFGWTQVGGG